MGKNVALEFRRLREAYGLSQAAVARGARGLSRTTVIAVESGESVRLETIRLVAQSIGLRRQELLGLLVAWVKDGLGEEFAAELIVKPRPGGKSRKSA